MRMLVNFLERGSMNDKAMLKNYSWELAPFSILLSFLSALVFVKFEGMPD